MQPKIQRDKYYNNIKHLISNFPVVALVGPRQVGKTTLARAIAASYDENVTYFDLENPTSLARLADPMLTLQSLRGLIVIDEIQHQSNLFKILRVLADEPGVNRKFLVLGSASHTLLRQTSESLAGRIAYLEISGFSLQEIGAEHLNPLWLRGGFPRAYLAHTQSDSVEWRQNFIRTFLERDLPQLGIQIPAITMRRFWMMLAHYHGQTWNASEFARAFGMTDKTVRHYLDILSSTFIVKQLAPWRENISKRQVKAPKIYLNDSGLLHTLLNLNNQEDLESHPKVGASWEGFAIQCVLSQLNVPEEEAFYWRTYTEAEIDLVIFRGNTRLGFEFKRTTAPTITRSIQIALEDLKLSHVYIIHAGKENYPLAQNVTALSLANMQELN
ncbi:MAG: ATP-binding protein [Gammaproteobacteria bacterium]|nr:ATP-binding protein [Gammaproteobacteria bacterium]